MSKILILYYSMYGHIKTMANSVAQGSKSVEGTDIVIKRVPELMPEELFIKSGGIVDNMPIADPHELEEYDAIIIGTPTRFGNMAAQMRNFLDKTGSLWVKGALIGKVGSVFTSTGTGGGNESTILSTHITLLHHGMIIVGLPYNIPELSDISENLGGSPYGSGTIAGADGSRVVHSKELAMARHQGKHVAEISMRLIKGSNL